MDDQTKLTMQSQDLSDLKFTQLQALFPQVITEIKDENGNIIRAINTELLEQEINIKVLDGNKERYEFTWPDRRQAIKMANTPTNAALRPCREESLNFDTTENLYIEGDNLEVLKLLRETYLNKVKMIYIDPPYNTGKDFVYHDNFTESAESFRERDGQYDDLDNRLVSNLESNGRFHTDWLNMMYPRLKLARDLLTESGLLFISINEKELANLAKIVEDVFGKRNIVATLVWTNHEGGGGSDSKYFRVKHEYIICVSKDIDKIDIIGVPISNINRYTLQDEFVSIRGKYYLQKLGMGTIQYSKSLDYPIQSPEGGEIWPADNNHGRKACWRWSKDKVEWGIANKFIEIKKNSSNIWTVYSKQYLKVDNEGNRITRKQRPTGVISNYSSTQASKMLNALGMEAFFDYSKPIELLCFLLKRTDLKEQIVLDFFSGSSSTAHAVMQLNAEDNGKRKFIMVQLPEETPENSPARNAGLETISDIGKERIRRAGRKIKEENHIAADDLDVGFRVLKLDSSNMKEVFYTPDEVIQADISFDGLVDNIKEDRSDEDLLFQVMLELGIPLSSKIEKRVGIFYVEETYLIACFQAIDNDQIKEIAKQEPYYVVFRDSSFANDSDSINFDQIFATYSPHTKRRVL